MPTHKKIDFFDSPAGHETRQLLTAMAADVVYNTESSYTANATLYPSNVLSFVDKHMDYLKAHPATDPQHYLANLRLMTRIR